MGRHAAISGRMAAGDQEKAGAGRNRDLARLILLPGLGADERMFGKIDPAGLPLVIRRHLIPEKGEDLPAFARRTAVALDLTAGDVIGGSSFGSVVAAAIARHRPVAGLVLIGGALDGSGLRSLPGAHLLRILPASLLRSLLRSPKGLEYVFGPEDREIKKIIRAMLADTPDRLLLEGSRMLVSYRSSQPVPCPVFAVHGGRDPIMKPPPVADCRLIPEAGHGLAWTHGAEVTGFLCRAMEKTAARPLA
jgi:pimeloyl-ACP methyl ester carboxylesterase